MKRNGLEIFPTPHSLISRACFFLSPVFPLGSSRRPSHVQRRSKNQQDQPLTLVKKNERSRLYRFNPGTEVDFMKRICPTARGSSSTSPAVKLIGALLIGGILFSTVQPLVTAVGGNKSVDTLLDAKLRKIPVFTVTDSTGRPFLSETDDGRLRRGYFFVQPADAEKYLEQVKEQNEDAKVLAIGLNEAIKFLDTRIGSAKSVPEKFEIFPDDHEAALAKDITNGDFQKSFGENGVPIFYIDGLAVKDSKDDPPVYPLFFEKETLDETIKDLKKKDPSAALDLKDLRIIDLKQTIKEIRAGSNPKLSRVVFVPLNDSLNRLRTTISK
ncbi:hypothetical protein BWQ96_06688 [Gracilariopsis chorda]|uniref:Protein TIC 22, chloroplastic n=1 Tax=Gracilariopsis chorda TaxID=448386 RepID=A0A2V3INB9_9FLOR|nr:hypothetical protein BWQ96_06688 [Gracilariopsis chorda]|eukprot:PXF43576.1 hypothetical protein BWQ96_06688 [Gracilariopsis chorda]